MRLRSTVTGIRPVAAMLRVVVISEVNYVKNVRRTRK